MLAATILYNVFMAVVVAATAFLTIRRPTLFWFVVRSCAVGVAAGAIAAVLAAGFGRGPFASARLLAYGLFIYYPIFAAVCAVAWWNRARRLSLFGVFCALAFAAVGVDAFFVEPQWLEVTRHEITSSKRQTPLKIGILADLQTDDVGDYERMVLERLLSEKPDLILLAGDYLQVESHDEWTAQLARLRELLADVPLVAPLGVYAVKGNVDHPAWREIFAGSAVQVFDATQSVNVPNSNVRVTCLEQDASFSTSTAVAGTERFHICLGHAPNFALGDVDADLLVAGHTHGGQVRMPLVGPLVTLSRVKRSWAAGLTRIDDSKHLIVSRGVGLERGDAPRLRFLCRPEVVIVDVVPTK